MMRDTRPAFAPRPPMTFAERFERALSDIARLAREAGPQDRAWVEKQRSRWWAYGRLVAGRRDACKPMKTKGTVRG